MRVDGVHGPEKKPTVQFIDDWSKLKEALGILRFQLNNVGPLEPVSLAPSTVEDLLHHVPALLDAYSECFELSLALTKAVEAQKASQNDLYVPDAQEVLANANRTQR